MNADYYYGLQKFYFDKIISSIIKWWTNSYYSHIGIVLVNPKIYDDNI